LRRGRQGTELRPLSTPTPASSDWDTTWVLARAISSRFPSR
jgi:hypothetical protein